MGVGNKDLEEMRLLTLSGPPVPGSHPGSVTRMPRWPSRTADLGSGVVCRQGWWPLQPSPSRDKDDEGPALGIRRFAGVRPTRTRSNDLDAFYPQVGGRL